jgi:hypothetical protein
MSASTCRRVVEDGGYLGKLYVILGRHRPSIVGRETRTVSCLALSFPQTSPFPFDLVVRDHFFALWVQKSYMPVLGDWQRFTHNLVPKDRRVHTDIAPRSLSQSQLNLTGRSSRSPIDQPYRCFVQRIRAYTAQIAAVWRLVVQTASANRRDHRFLP